MRPLVLCIAAFALCCTTSKRAAGPETAGKTSGVAGRPSTATATEAAAEFAVTTYVDESTRAQGVVCVQFDRDEDRGKVLDRLMPLAARVSADPSDCLERVETSAIVSIGRAQTSGDRARVDVGVVRGNAGMLELEQRQGVWLVVRETRAWISPPVALSDAHHAP